MPFVLKKISEMIILSKLRWDSCMGILLTFDSNLPQLHTIVGLINFVLTGEFCDDYNLRPVPNNPDEFKNSVSFRPENG